MSTVTQTLCRYCNHPIRRATKEEVERIAATGERWKHEELGGLWGCSYPAADGHYHLAEPPEEGVTPTEYDRMRALNAELLEALKLMLDLDPQGEDCTGVNDDCHVCVAVKAAKTAIAKAEGKQG